MGELTTNERKILDFIRAEGGQAAYVSILSRSGLSYERASFYVERLADRGAIKRVINPPFSTYAIGGVE